MSQYIVQGFRRHRHHRLAGSHIGLELVLSARNTQFIVQNVEAATSPHACSTVYWCHSHRHVHLLFLNTIPVTQNEIWMKPCPCDFPIL